MSKNSEHVIRWRQVTKQRIIDAMGGACCTCSYSTSRSALELHHLDPGIKEFQIAQARVNPMSWEKICNELRKCILVCANCHREIHDGLRSVPEDVKRFDEEYADYKQAMKDAKQTFCPICSGPKRAGAKACSPKCSAQRRSKGDWGAHDLVNLATHMTNKEIADLVGVSDVAVSKRLIKLGIRRRVER